MSQIVLDEQLDAQIILAALEPWITTIFLPSLRPGQQILDDRVPELLCTLKTPTFVTIDKDFWKRRLCHRGYCILYFALRTEEQHLLSPLLRRLLHLPEFGTRAARMGKVARVEESAVTYWEGGKKFVLELDGDD
jgi:hypothetical protein